MLIDQRQFLAAIEQISEEKGISRDQILETIEAAIAAAYKKEHNLKGHKVVVKFNIESGSTDLFEEKDVVEDMTEEELEQQQKELEELKSAQKEEAESGNKSDRSRQDGDDDGDDEDRPHIFNPNKEIMISEAKKIKKSIKVGDVLTTPLEAEEDYGRIAAQTAKQVIIQKIRETERETVYNELKDKEETVVSGTIQRMENNTVFFELGRATGILTRPEQIPHEQYRAGTRMRVYVLKVEKNLRGPAILLSRTRPEILQKLFELEVPEITDGSVEIKAIAREPGSRSKVAVMSHEDEIDPIGACVGQKGTRVSTIINELGGENIDIILWDEDLPTFISNALSPAKVITVELNESKTEKIAIVRVAQDQLSLAIGRSGQNVRLAAKLTGWKIDVHSETEGEDESTEKDEKKDADSPADEEKPKKKAVKKKAAKDTEADAEEKPATKKKVAKKAPAKKTVKKAAVKKKTVTKKAAKTSKKKAK